jgi:hypothetical protein
MEEVVNIQKVTKSEKKRLLGRLRCRWDDNIKIDRKENRISKEIIAHKPTGFRRSTGKKVRSTKQ